MVASFVFVSVVMLNEPLLKCELKLWYAGFFPSWQSAVVQEAVEFPDDFIGRKAQTLALELPVADDAAQKAKLKIAEQILQSRHRAPESYALAAAVKLAYLTKDASLGAKTQAMGRCVWGLLCLRTISTFSLCDFLSLH
ncbi:MAG: hypothetical protein IPL73_30015 [Candidatus Obscuribacter sp.]|nr:hypothetical protein [Candidatus Obscuribacter sp.]